MAMATLTRHARGLIPAERGKRLYTLNSAVNAIGLGMWMSGTAVFAVRVLRLSPQQVSFSFSAAGLAGLLASASVGTLVDRFGARRVLLLACSLAGIADLGYCVLRSFVAFMILTCLTAVLTSCIVVAMAAYAASIATGSELIRLRALTRSMGNAGFGAGAGLAALLLAIGTTPVLYLLPVGDAVSFFAMTLMTVSLPRGRGAAQRSPVRALPALRNLPFLITTVLNAVLRMHESLLLIIVPLWIVTHTSAPRAIIGLLLVLNTTGCVLFQVKASVGTETLAGSVRKVRLAAAVMLPACILFALSGRVPAGLAVLLVTAGCIALTSTEMLQCAGEWGTLYALAPPDALGDYAGAFAMSGPIQQIVGPAFGGWLVLRYGTGGWMILGVVVILAASALGPAARWAASMMRDAPHRVKATVTVS